MAGHWPENWSRLIDGSDCEMCEAGRPESDQYGIRIHAGEYSDAYLQRADVQRGYTVVIWRGRHVNDPTELTGEEASSYWADVLLVARALITYYEPLKMNYETLGNALPHLHTHLVPRYAEGDPAPGRPFPLGVILDGPEPLLDTDRLERDASALQKLVAGI